MHLARSLRDDDARGRPGAQKINERKEVAKSKRPHSWHPPIAGCAGRNAQIRFPQGIRPALAGRKREPLACIVLQFRDSGNRGRSAGKACADVDKESKGTEVSTRQYQQIRKWEDLVREILPGTGRSPEARSTRGNIVKKMIAEQYVVFNVAAGLKTPKTARRQ